jgi:mRNA interferase MazF
MAGRLTRGEVRLYRFPDPDKERPVVVLTRDNLIDRLSTVMIASITSSIRGAVSEVVLDEGDGMKKTCAVNLHNTATVPQQRLGRKVAQLSEKRMGEICAALRFSIGCD